MKYIIIYFDEGVDPTAEETEWYAIYRVDEERNKMQCFYEVVKGKAEHFTPGSIWFKADLGLHQAPYTELTEEEVFAICL